MPYICCKVSPYNYVKISPHNCCKMSTYNYCEVLQMLENCTIVLVDARMILCVLPVYHRHRPQWHHCSHCILEAFPMKLLHVTHKNCNFSELAEFPCFGDSSCDSYWSCRSSKSGVSGDLGDLDKSDGFSESGESIVSGNLVIIVILVILVLLVIMVILVILVIGNFIINFFSLV